MTFVYPGQSNVVVPQHEATHGLVIDFARNQSKFAVNRYCQIVPVTKITGLYLQMALEEAGRIQNVDLSEFVWPDNMDSPTGVEGTEGFVWQNYLCKRLAYRFRLGQLTVENADWKIVQQHAQKKAQQAMTGRTQLAINALTTSTNYTTPGFSSNYIPDVTAVAGISGKLSDSTTARQDIKRLIEYCLELIRDNTLDAIELDNMQMVMNSYTAAILSQTQEFVDYIKSSPVALQQIRGEVPGGTVDYGLPEKLYGLPIVVESTRKVTNAKGATRAVSQVLANGTILITSRPGGLVGAENGGPSFSTVSLMAFEEMTTETRTDTWNRYTEGRITENLAAVVTAPGAGCLITSAI